VADVVRAGAQILVAGSAIFEQGDPRENARQLLESVRETANQAGQDFSSVVAGGPTDNGRISLDPP